MNIGKAMKNVGSRATRTATAKAERVAMGGGDKVRLNTPTTVMPPIKRRLHKGSSAGYRNEKKVFLNMEGTGYLNPANQIARNKNRVKKTTPTPSMNILTSVGSATRNKTFDMRVHGSNCGSVKLLRERL